jgi:hypothetical protein
MNPYFFGQKLAVDLATRQRLFGNAAGAQMHNRSQALKAQANQLQAANPKAKAVTGTFQQGKLTQSGPMPAAGVPSPAANKPAPVPAKPMYPKKSVTSDEAADFF